MDSNVRAGSSPAFSTDEKKPEQLFWFFCFKPAEKIHFRRWAKNKKTTKAKLSGFFSQNDVSGLAARQTRQKLAAKQKNNESKAFWFFLSK